MSAFDDFRLHPQLLRGVRDQQFATPTPVQMAAIPPALLGRDVLASAATGSGKTAAFGLPLLNALLEQPRGKPRALVLAPTRELAEQIATHLKALASQTPLSVASVHGGVGFGAQAQAFRRGVDVVVATPGRLLDHLEQRTASLADISILVLDEADRMLDMGFLPVVRRILKAVPRQRQTLFFSATIPPPIVALTKEMLVDPVRVDLGSKSRLAGGITQTIYSIEQNRKTDLLVELLKDGGIFSALAFTRTKARANRLAAALAGHNITVERIHGNRSQAQRTRALANFKSGKYRVLVATDIAARGIDIVDLDLVVNYDVPEVPDDYVHRVGRTARADATGDAVTFVSTDEEPKFAEIERALGRRLTRATNPVMSAQPTRQVVVPVSSATRPLARKSFGHSQSRRSKFGPRR